MVQDNFECGHVYHVYNCGNNGEDIFKERRNYVLFLDLMKHHLLPAVDIYAYCLLRNHFHLLIKIKYADEIADEKLCKKPHLAFSHMLNAYTQSVNKSVKRKGSLFQEHLRRKRVIDENYLIQLVVYIHLNPVKHGFSNSPEDYLYSSYKAMISDKKTLLNRAVVLDYFGDRENFIYWHDFKKLTHEQIKLLDNEEY
jgi:REP element-mobilizing transposase RayT